MAAVTSIMAGASAAIAAGGAGVSWAQASKQNKLASEAETAAAKAMEEAKRDLGKNYYEALSIQKEPYELSREGLLASAGMLTEAARESERGAAEAAGKIYLASQQGQGQVRAAMGQELSNLEKLTAQEESRLRDTMVGINLQEATGAQQAIADAERAKAQYIQGGFSALQQGIQQNIQMLPLYFKGKKTTPTTDANNLVMQNKENKPLYDPFGIGKLGSSSQTAMLSQPFYTYPSGQYDQNPLSPNQPPYNPLTPNMPPYNPNIYNPFNIGG